MKECAKAAAAPWKDSPSYLFINPLYVVLFVARPQNRTRKLRSGRKQPWPSLNYSGCRRSRGKLWNRLSFLVSNCGAISSQIKSYFRLPPYTDHPFPAAAPNSNWPYRMGMRNEPINHPHDPILYTDESVRLFTWIGLRNRIVTFAHIPRRGTLETSTHSTACNSKVPTLWCNSYASVDWNNCYLNYVNGGRHWNNLQD